MENKFPSKWYLKYDHKITREIYDDLIDYLFKLGYKFENHCSMPLSYGNFKRKEFLRSYFEEDNNKFCIDNNCQPWAHLQELKIEDILSIISNQTYDIY